MVNFQTPAKVGNGGVHIPPVTLSELILREERRDYWIQARKQRWTVNRPMYAAEAQRFNPPTLRELQWAYFGFDESGLPVNIDYQDELFELSKKLEIDKVLGEWTSSWIIDGRYLLERPKITVHYAKKFIRLVEHLLEPPNCRTIEGAEQGYILEIKNGLPTKLSGDEKAAKDACGYLFVSAVCSVLYQFDGLEELEVPFSELEEGRVVRYTKQGFPEQTVPFNPFEEGPFTLENRFNGNAHLTREGITSTAVLYHSPIGPLISFNINSFLPYSGGDGIGVRRSERN